MGRGIAANAMLPGNQAVAQHRGIDSERIAYRVEAKRMRSGLGRHHDPSLGVNIEEALAGGPGNRTLLIDINRVGQQRQHQALLGGQAMAAGNIEVLRGENLMETHQIFHD